MLYCRIIWCLLLLSSPIPVDLSQSAEGINKCPRECQCTAMNMVYMYCGFEEGFKSLTVFPSFIPLQVEILSLYSNKLTTIPEDALRNLTHLTTLNLRSNQLRDFPATVFRDLAKLRSFNAGLNKLSTLHGRLFDGLNNLQELYLDNNALESIPEELFQDLPSLRRLDLHYNRLKTLPGNAFRGTHSLQGLSLANNYLAFIHEETFSNLSTLRRLTLTGNRITNIPVTLFRKLSSLAILRLENNNISTIQVKTFAGLKAGIFVLLSGNPFYCDCQLRWLKDWLRAKAKYIPSRSRLSTTCSQPDRLKGNPLIYVTDNQFSCINGQWSEWGPWSACSVTCGSGTRVSRRHCTNPPPGRRGGQCNGEGVRMKSCHGPDCGGSWTAWSEWSKCSQTCSSGNEIRTRSCQNPVTGISSDRCRGASKESRLCIQEPCSTDGAWGSWSRWSQCSVTCSWGTRVRTRNCDNPRPRYGGNPCPHTDRSTRTEICYLGSCPVHGGWSAWSSWSKCSASCLTGTRIRHRNCNNPIPQYGGNLCDGASTQMKNCSSQECPIDGRWASWSRWSDCSRTCSRGSQVRFRTCSDPSPQHGGQSCTGNSSDFRNCDFGPCPVNGHWGAWSPWSDCSKTCNKGTRSRNRTCSNPPPQHGGKKCRGNSSEDRHCDFGPCPVHGHWTTWSPWDDCSKTCASGTQSRNRTCSNPSPQYGGKQCPGNFSETRHCDMGPCPVHGQWTAWSLWSDCSKTCSSGTQSRSRTCSNPPPQHGGKKCPGNSSEDRHCDFGPCPVHGHWGAWSPWSDCSKTCGRGTQSHNRTCSNPSPQYGGKQCPGNSSEDRHCDMGPCPVHGQWTAWSLWSDCSKTCSSGTQSRGRTCSNPPPQHAGKKCPGNSSEDRHCDLGPCPVHGQWTAWSLWSDCSKTCASGTQSRSRTCSNPSPQHGGQNCLGNSSDLRHCNLGPCPVHGQWATWSLWSECSKTCANGTKSRQRTCSSPFSKFGGKNCSGERVEIKPCTAGLCPIHGKWSAWSQWSECSTSCSSGIKSRTRTCSNPLPRQGGETCVGNSTETEGCLTLLCPIHGGWGDWSNWTDCTTTCGNGTKSRYRNCDNPLPQHGGEYCTGDSRQSEHCSWQSCSVVGKWTEWSNWRDCSKTCDVGQQARTRSCKNSHVRVAESASDNPCSGNETDMRACYKRPCPDKGEWNEWSPWSKCSVTCGLGRQQRIKNCSSSEGHVCLGSLMQVKSCYQNDCPVNGGWSSWSNWTECSSSCGAGAKAKFRFCINPKPHRGGESCHGKNVVIKSCKIAECRGASHQNDSFWSSWTRWSQCSATCSTGTRTRSRYCRKKVNPFHLGNCSGVTGPVQVESNICEIQPCAAWSSWSSWDTCSQSCGGGMQHRVRTCKSLTIEMTCQGENSQAVNCNTNPCPLVIPPVTYPPKINLGSPNTCSDPDKPLNGYFKITDQDGSYFATYHCNKHYYVHGPRLRHCESDGTWSDYVPYCLPVCGESSLSFVNVQHQRLRIFGGGTSPHGLWPWQVALTVNNLFHCGGSLIAEDWIVTAAHCVYHQLTKKRYSRIKVYLGVHDILSGLKDPHVQMIDSRDIVPHPNFNWKTFDSDLALIQLKEKANITDYVRPVCLPNKQQRRKVAPGKMGVMLGWGLTEKDSPSTKLRQVYMPVVGHSSCQKAYKKETWPITSNMLCAGYASNAKDSCKRDSGGGFLFPESKGKKKKWFLGGIISWGNPRCGTPGKYSVFTHINSRFSRWIKNYIYN